MARRLLELRMTALGRPVKGLAVASAIGVSKQSLWEWEHGRHVPREQALEKLARFFVKGDPERAGALRSELLDLRVQALAELHRESAQAPPTRRRSTSATPGEMRLTSLDPALIHEYARLVGIEYLEACDELFPALARRRLDVVPAVPARAPAASYARQVLTAYYSDGSLALADLAPYEVEINGRPLRLALTTRPHWIGLSIPLGPVGGSSPQERCTFMPAPGSPIDAQPFRTPALSFLCDVETRGLEIYDAPIFRLMSLDAEGGSLSAAFCTDSFLRYRLTVGLLADELAQAVARTSSLDDLLCSLDRAFPLRRASLPDRNSLAAMGDRLCAGGVLTLLAIARDRPHDDFVVVAQRRGSAVSDSQGLLSVIPRAFHQPSALPHSRTLRAEVRPSATMYRELFEEIFGGREVELADRDLEPLWFIDHSRPLRWLREHPGSYVGLCVALATNLLSGNYEIGTLLVVHDPKFWRLFESTLRPNWEVGNLIQCSTRPGIHTGPKRGLAGLIRSTEGWTSEGLLVLIEGLARLRQLFPERVCLPSLEIRRLAPVAAELL
ncbi:MAG TPA: helix-turn-helix transcriptional regulator [Actinomycetota bacterium]|nr:helix-turn-helix transcriptional regulator [Actinomycetota bacterium]